MILLLQVVRVPILRAFLVRHDKCFIVGLYQKSLIAALLLFICEGLKKFIASMVWRCRKQRQGTTQFLASWLKTY